MSWTYSGDPAYSDRDAVRFLIQDTDMSDQLVQDEEINWMITQQSNIYFAAARLARSIGSRFTDQATSMSVGGLSRSYADRGGKYLELADSLETSAKTGVGAIIKPYSGGISQADKDEINSDTDYVKPWAYYGIHDNPGTGTVALSTDYT